MAEKTAFELALDKDLDKAFFSDKEFAAPVIVMPSSAASYTVKGIFDAEHETVTPDTEQGVSTTQPVLQLDDNSISHDIKTDTATLFVIKEKQYKIVDIQPDGVGTTKYLLHEK